MFTSPVAMAVAKGMNPDRFSGAKSSDGLLSWPFLLEVNATIRGRPDWSEK
jgi:hypothetical protein